MTKLWDGSGRSLMVSHGVEASTMDYCSTVAAVGVGGYVGTGTLVRMGSGNPAHCE